MATILTVDDEPYIRTLLAAVFGANHLVLKASNGMEGLHMLALHEVDLIITDLQMPIMSGLDFVRHVRRFPGKDKVKIIATSTSFYFPEQRNAMQKAGADLCLEKPVDVETIQRAVARLLDEKGVFAGPDPKECSLRLGLHGFGE